eukprot:2120314-Pyramimonas_sp.AAC.1
MKTGVAPRLPSAPNQRLSTSDGAEFRSEARGRSGVERPLCDPGSTFGSDGGESGAVAKDSRPAARRLDARARGARASREERADRPLA